jgi:C4-dicarboxylate-specific signal transduction histidine kinase
MGGVGRVRLAAAPDGEAVELQVADAGPGLSPDDLPRLFDPFFTTKPPGEGTGLGLATSLRIVETLGGTLTAENGTDGGALFRLRLPAAGAAPGRPPATC